MFKDIQVTLYDFFGYLFPGLIVLFALTIIFWSVCWPTSAYVVYTDFSAPVIAILILSSYLAGHLAQACGNFLEKLPVAKDALEKKLLIDDKLGSVLKKTLVHRFGSGANELSHRETYRLCDQVLVHHGSAGEREIFTYREGFYRGVCIALGVLTVGLIMRAMRLPVKLWFGDAPMVVPLRALILGIALSALGCWLCFRRYVRFAEYRIRTCLLRFLALSTEPASPKKEGAKDG